jgi:hypothetical protein
MYCRDNKAIYNLLAHVYRDLCGSTGIQMQHPDHTSEDSGNQYTGFSNPAGSH